MKKTINLLQLQKVAHKSLTDKEFLFSSINNDDTPAHIDYRLIFQNMKIIPDKNEIVFSNKDGKINIRAVCYIVISLENGYLDIVSKNYIDSKNPHIYRVLTR